MVIGYVVNVKHLIIQAKLIVMVVKYKNQKILQKTLYILQKVKEDKQIIIINNKEIEIIINKKNQEIIINNKE